MDKMDGYYFFDKGKGLVIPSRLAQITSSPNPISPAKGNGGTAVQTAQGTRLDHDPQFGTPRYPNYGSGYDDILNRAIAMGSMANGGMTPVIDPLVTTIVSKLQMMAATWTISLRGRRSPLMKALDLINSADDGDGSQSFVRSVMGAMLVDNRGVFISYAPIGRIDYDTWGEYGLQTEELPDKGGTYRVLTMTTGSKRENRGVWTVDGLECVPTGVPEYPYWIRKKSRADKKTYWILVPREYGTQIIQQIGGKTVTYAGMGTSNVWVCAKYIAKGIVLERMDWESLTSRPPEGIVLLTAADSPTQLHDDYRRFKTEKRDEGNLLFDGVMFASTTNENARLQVIGWSSPPPGYDPEKWDKEKAQAVAGAFHVSPVHVRAAMIGSGQAIDKLMASLEGETSLAYARSVLETILNMATPPRVYVRLVPKTDSQLHRQAETLAVFALGLGRMQKQFGTQNPDEAGNAQEVLTIAEVRALIEQEIGIKIPDTSEGVEQADSRETSDEIEATFINPQHLSPVTAAFRSSMTAEGNIVCDGAGRLFVSTGQGTSMFLWCKPLVGVGRYLLPIGDIRGIPPTELIAAMMIAEKASPSLPLRSGFVPDGEPLPEPTEDDAVVDDWAAAAESALEVWRELAEGTGYEALLEEWEWDPETRAWIDPDTGQPLTAAEMAAIRQALIDQGSSTEQTDDGSLVNQLIVAAIALSVWEELMRQRVLYIHLALYMFGNGDTELTDADHDRIQTEQLRQITFLNGFSRGLSTGEIGEDEARNRAGLYYDAAAGSHERGRLSAWNQDMTLPCQPGDCTSECCSRCGCYWDISTDGDLVTASWHRTRTESCSTCISREGCEAITFNPESGEYTNRECYGGNAEEDDNG